MVSNVGLAAWARRRTSDFVEAPYPTRGEGGLGVGQARVTAR